MSESESQDLLRRLAERVADGEPIDWTLETAGLGENERRMLGHLRAIEEISQSHRDLFPPAAEPETLPFERWGPLKLIEKTAEGGFGEVFRAEDERLGRMVALKLLPSDESRFVEEARKLAEVSHPNVVTVHGVDHNQGRTGMWMEWLEGETLDERLRREGPSGAREAALIGVDLCRALSAVHKAGLVHRDVKLRNLLRERGGRLVLMDFGSSSRRVGGSDGDRVSGTPAYLAPELLEGRDSGVRGDIYAAGVCLYRLTSGSFPLAGTDVDTIRAQHREGAYRPLSDANPHLPTAFIEVVERAMSPDPDQRYRSAGELEQALRGVLGTEVSGEPIAVARPPRWPWLAAAAAVVAVTALVLAWPVLFPLQVEAAFYRLNAINGTEERLGTDTRLYVGDQLFLELEANRPVHVYAIAEDGDGRIFRLFPIEQLDQTNPVSGGRRHRLPGSIQGTEQFWGVTSSGGEESITVVASRKPLGDVAEMILALPTGGEPEPPEADPPALIERLRGIGGLAPSRAPRRSGPDLASIRKQVDIRSNQQSNVYILEVQYQNPRSP